ncbi:MAG: hypothetical protein CL889_03350 [Dehalococcoidia bacterium]|nr:hypothetical protein [Dehalococcoidia bacterium]
MSSVLIGLKSGDFRLLGYSGSEVRISWNNSENSDKDVRSYVPKGFRQIDLNAVQWLKKISHEPFLNDKSLHQSLLFEASTLWWFFESSLYREIFKEISRCIAVLDAIFVAEKPLSISIVNDNSVVYKTVKKYCEYRNLCFNQVETSYKETNNRKALWRPAALKFRNILRSAFAPKFEYSESKFPRILVTSMAREQVSVNKHTKKQEPEDLILSSVMNELATRECTVIQLYKYPYGNRVRVPANTFRAKQAVTWDSFRGSRIHSSYKKQKSVIKKEWLRLSENYEFRNLWNYQGVPLWEIISDVLRDLWFTNGNAAAEYLLLAKEILGKTKPDIVVMASDTSLDNKAILAQSNRLNIPVISLQHGTILPEDDYLCDYSHIKSDFDVSPSRLNLYPQITCLFGPESYSVMTNEIGYAYNERLKKIGQPRFDQLMNNFTNEEKSSFLEAFELNPDKKSALIASQTFKIAGNKDAFFEVILNTLKNIDDLQIMVKPHPVEPASYIKNLAHRLGVKVTVLPSNFDITQAIKACDFLITSYSTVAIEAMVASKPVVTVNLTGMPDVIPYARAGASLGVVSSDELLSTVIKIIEDPSFVHRQTASAKKYIDQELSHCDGKVTERFVELVLEQTNLV